MYVQENITSFKYYPALEYAKFHSWNIQKYAIKFVQI